MAKKSFDELAKELISDCGKNDSPSEVTNWIDTGNIGLNEGSSGSPLKGMPSGRVIEIIGAPSSGKTFLSTILMRNTQRMGGIAAFNDHERTFQESLGVKNGLDTSQGRWFYRKPKTLEESFEIYEKFVRRVRELKIIDKDAPICFVFDSVAAMIPSSQYGKNFSDLNMNDMTALARSMSIGMKVISLLAEEYNVLTLFINQIREKPGVMFGDPTTSPGGNALKFFASQRINLGSSKDTKGEGTNKVVVGNTVTAVFIKNKVSKPFVKAKWKFTFGADGSGEIDNLGTAIETAMSRGVLDKPKKGYFTYDGQRLNMSQLRAYIEKNGGYEALNKKIIAEGIGSPEIDEEARLLMEEEEARQAALGALEDI